MLAQTQQWSQGPGPSRLGGGGTDHANDALLTPPPRLSRRPRNYQIRTRNGGERKKKKLCGRRWGRPRVQRTQRERNHGALRTLISAGPNGAIGSCIRAFPRRVWAKARSAKLPAQPPETQTAASPSPLGGRVKKIGNSKKKWAGAAKPQLLAYPGTRAILVALSVQRSGG